MAWQFLGAWPLVLVKRMPPNHVGVWQETTLKHPEGSHLVLHLNLPSPLGQPWTDLHGLPERCPLWDHGDVSQMLTSF